MAPMHRGLWPAVGLWAALATACSAQPVGQALQEELLAEWERELSAMARPVNPSGEVAGAATGEDAAGAVDGVKDGTYGFHTTFSLNPWWQVDLQQVVALDRVVVYNRGERPQRADGLIICVSQDGQEWTDVFRHSAPTFGGAYDGHPLVVDLRSAGVSARFVRCRLEKEVSFHLDEVEVYATADPQANIALGRPADQSSAGRWSCPKPGAAAHRRSAVSPDRVSEVLRRAGDLLHRFRGLDPSYADHPARQAINALKARLESVAEATPGLYFDARALLRAVALSNPLLDDTDLLFVKRHPGTFAHMCDQFYGSYARPGGGLFILKDLQGEPRLQDLIGDRLPEGSFLSPDLSDDGTRIAFAYVPVNGLRTPAFEASPKTCYHLYTINVDGSDLRQLTDGPWDDFGPCWLPNGELVFISSRRGGYCRCGGRPVPTYTLHRIRADGSGLRRLSSHETNEWTPAVGNDGSVIYTRWDYVDRHTNLAHSLWSCRPDGTQPFALYGNYNAERKPWGEWHAQPVPGSHKLMAVAGAHHGYAYGSLVLIDPRQGYDGLGSVQRLTPEVPFPEAEGYPGQAYTTPYPLSEDFWLTSYSPEWSTRNASHATTQGLYLQDRFGNRELIYRDPGISCEYARPVRARRRPPAYAEIGADAPACGTMLLTNAYDSALDLPRVEITALRVVQVLPKTTPNADDPPISAARQVSARQLLGTVPVEQDGSACFVAPAGVPLYLQTVGADGMAVQTMRSLTYLQPGETTACVGCHEPRNTTPANRVPLALRRPPSTLAPGPEGSLPFSYPRLVQPVWDRHCVACHGATEPAGGMCLTGGLPDGSAYSHSYRALARKEWVHWFDSVNGGEWIALTTPGQFGARASRLSAFLRSGHGGVVLPAEDLARVNLWLDVNVPFYGAYEARHVAAQRESEAIPLGELLP